MKRFKSKKNHNYLIIYVSLFLISISFTIKYLYQKDMINEDTIVDLLVNDNLKKYKDGFKSVDFLLKYALDINLKKSELVFNNNEYDNKEESVNNNEEPIVYLYNTHQEEKYKSTYLGEYNVDSNVKIASKILKEYLEKMGIYTIVEEDSITEKLHSFNWKYGYSYKVSRMFLESAYKENPSLKYFIDIHRDSSPYEKTTIEIDNKKYARLLFVVGLDHDNYEPNLELAQKLGNRIKSYNSNLFRGIMKKSGPKVNGIYNQDFNSNVMLIEVGGQYNNIKEVNNTLEVLASILKEFIEEENA